MVCLAGNSWDAVSFSYEVVMFYNWEGDAEDVCFLECVFTKHPCDLLAADEDHWHGVHLSCHESCNCISCAWS